MYNSRFNHANPLVQTQQCIWWFTHQFYKIGCSQIISPNSTENQQEIETTCKIGSTYHAFPQKHIRVVMDKDEFLKTVCFHMDKKFLVTPQGGKNHESKRVKGIFFSTEEVIKMVHRGHSLPCVENEFQRF